MSGKASPREYSAVRQSETPLGPPPPIPAEEVHPEPEYNSLTEWLSAKAMANKSFSLIGIIVGVVVLAVVILLAMSFATLEYYEMGFARRKSTGAVDTSNVYVSGRHAVGPDYEFKVFPAGAHFESFNKVTVFASDRLQVQITAHMQYFLRPHQLELLHKSFDIHYAPVLRNNAQDALKGAATLFSTREYIHARERVEEDLFKAVKERLGGKCCELNCEESDDCVPGCLKYERCQEDDFGLFAEVRYFQLAALDIPGDLEERYLRALVLQEETEGEQFKQMATLVRKQTSRQVKDTQNKALELSENAESESRLIKVTAAANSTAIRESARTKGLKHLYTELKLNSNQHKASFDYLRTLMEKDDVKLAIDFDQLIAGSFGEK